uniref:Uncharacterized protein n=1 Tax=Acrobeloides nanus TaxID=290746 RepID=A0A914DG85_9BILA
MRWLLRLFLNKYDPKASDDAEKNAHKLREFCSETTFDQENYVANLIIESGSNCTDAHLSKTEFGADDIHYLIDFDMAYLGDVPEKYDEHSKNIHQEFGHLNETEYREQRIKVLELFLQVPNIYATRDFRERFEDAARKNIQHEIDSLNKQKLSEAVDAIKEGAKGGSKVKKFTTIEEMRESLTEFFASKDRDWYRSGIHQLEEQLQKMIESDGEYF